jgi:hypothetical protein
VCPIFVMLLLLLVYFHKSIMVVIVSDSLRCNLTKWLLYLNSINAAYLRTCEREYVDRCTDLARSILFRGISRWRNGSCYRYVDQPVGDRLSRDITRHSFRGGGASLSPIGGSVISDGTFGMFGDSYSPSSYLAIRSLHNGILSRNEYAPGVLREMCDDFWAREVSQSDVGELYRGLRFTNLRRSTVILHVYLRVGNRAMKYEIRFVLMSGGGFYDVSSSRADPL